MKAGAVSILVLTLVLPLWGEASDWIPIQTDGPVQVFRDRSGKILSRYPRTSVRNVMAAVREGPGVYLPGATVGSTEGNGLEGRTYYDLRIDVDQDGQTDLSASRIRQTYNYAPDGSQGQIRMEFGDVSVASAPGICAHFDSTVDFVQQGPDVVAVFSPEYRAVDAIAETAQHFFSGLRTAFPFCPGVGLFTTFGSGFVGTAREALYRTAAGGIGAVAAPGVQGIYERARAMETQGGAPGPRLARSHQFHRAHPTREAHQTRGRAPLGGVELPPDLRPGSPEFQEFMRRLPPGFDLYAAMRGVPSESARVECHHELVGARRDTVPEHLEGWGILQGLLAGDPEALRIIGYFR